MSARALVAFLAAVVACTEALVPVDPVWGKQPCAICTMVISDKRFGAQLATDTDHVFFDDPGCMATWVREHPGARKMWVRSPSGEWVSAKSARFSRGQRSPMDYGFAADLSGDAAWSDVEDAAKARAEARR